VTVGIVIVAKVKYDKHSISLKLNEINYLLAKITILENQLDMYNLAQTDVNISSSLFGASAADVHQVGPDNTRIWSLTTRLIL
jgi:hypothetical protein